MFGPHVGRSFSRGRGRPPLLAHILAARREARALDFDARAFQVFVANPRSLAITLRPEEAAELRAFLEENPRLAVVAHGTYLDAPWGGSPYVAKFIRAELALCARAGISGLVIHLGKTPPATVVRRLPPLGGGPGPLLYLETPAVKPENARYETPEKLAALFRAIRAGHGAPARVGLCIDTAHLWSSGVDLRSYEAAAAWIRRLEAAADAIPPGRILLHLNDNFNARGGGRDRHAPLFRGAIWGGYADRPRESGLAAFVEYAVRHGTPAIFERGGAALREWLAADYSAVWGLTPAVRA